MDIEFDANVPECVVNCPVMRTLLTYAVANRQESIYCNFAGEEPETEIYMSCAQRLEIEYRKRLFGLVGKTIAQVSGSVSEETAACFHIKDQILLINSLGI